MQELGLLAFLSFNGRLAQAQHPLQTCWQRCGEGHSAQPLQVCRQAC